MSVARPRGSPGGGRLLASLVVTDDFARSVR